MSNKFDGADDAAVLVSRKQLAELERDAAHGRILLECGEALAEIDKDYLEKNPRTAKDVRQAVLDCLVIIGDRFRGAGMFKAHVCALPWPLFLLMMEIVDVSEGHFSPLLTPATKCAKPNARPKGESATNTACAKGRAAAIVTYERLTECDAWADGNAADAIAKIFQERGIKVKSPKSSARRNKTDETVTPDTVKEWFWKRGSATSRLAYEIDCFRKLADCLYQVSGYSRVIESLGVTSGFYSTEIAHLQLIERCDYDDKDRCDLLLDFLRRYIAGTAYET